MKKEKKIAYERKKVKKKREKNYLHSKRAHMRVVLHEHFVQPEPKKKREKSEKKEGKERENSKRDTCVASRVKPTAPNGWPCML